LASGRDVSFWGGGGSFARGGAYPSRPSRGVGRPSIDRRGIAPSLGPDAQSQPNAPGRREDPDRRVRAGPPLATRKRTGAPRACADRRARRARGAPVLRGARARRGKWGGLCARVRARLTAVPRQEVDRVCPVHDSDAARLRDSPAGVGTCHGRLRGVGPGQQGLSESPLELSEDCTRTNQLY
jgi:hypothetical protein